MSKLKSTLLAAVMVAGPFAASSALAVPHWELWNGTAWVQAGTLTVTGPTTATVAGIPVPCTVATFTLTLTGGVAEVSNAAFGTSGPCTGITATQPPSGASSLNWPLAAPVITSGVTSVPVSISHIAIHFTQPAAYCPASIGGPPPTPYTYGSASGTLTNANNNPTHTSNNFTFTATFPNGPCTSVKSTGNLVTSKPLRAMP